MMTLNSEGVNLRTLQVKEIGDDAQGLRLHQRKVSIPKARPQIRAWHEIASFSDINLPA